MKRILFFAIWYLLFSGDAVFVAYSGSSEDKNVILSPREGTLEMLSTNTRRVEFTRWGKIKCRIGSKEYKRKNGCGLAFVEFVAEEYRVWAGGSWSYGSQMFARYRTRSPGTLEDYVFVQYIRGCMYTVRFEDGVWNVYYDVVRKQFGKDVLFRHETWEFDNVYPERIYYAVPGYPTHYWYRWNDVAGSFERKTEHVYGEEKPPVSELYVRDRPSTAFFMEEFGAARNVSLELVICLYSASQVPRGISKEEIDLSDALACFAWKSSFVFNPETKEFEGRDGIVSECAEVNE